VTAYEILQSELNSRLKHYRDYFDAAILAIEQERVKLSFKGIQINFDLFQQS
jgi:hypothetical protein